MLSKMAGIVAFHEPHISNAVHVQLLNTINDMGAVQGACDRMLGTPMPMSFTRHAARSIMLYLLTLPVALWPIFGLLTTPVVLVITYVLLGEFRCDHRKTGRDMKIQVIVVHGSNRGIVMGQRRR